jgi:hypothetical protein
MTSVLRFLKQIPSDIQYFVAARPNIGLNTFTPDVAASTTSYVSGAAAGSFAYTQIAVTSPFAPSDISGMSGLSIFRDMGKTVISSGRMFRRVQLLNLDGNGGSGWTSTAAGTPGVWQPGVNGVQGVYNPSATTDSNYGVYYFETGANGLGLAQGLVRFG